MALWPADVLPLLLHAECSIHALPSCSSLACQPVLTTWWNPHLAFDVHHMISQTFYMQALFRRGQLKALVDLHSETEGLGGQLAAEEINVIRGALDLTNKTAAKGMTPLDKVSCRYRCICPCLSCPTHSSKLSGHTSKIATLQSLFTHQGQSHYFSTGQECDAWTLLSGQNAVC